MEFSSELLGDLHGAPGRPPRSSMETSTESPYSYAEAPDGYVFSSQSHSFVYGILHKKKNTVGYSKPQRLMEAHGTP